MNKINFRYIFIIVFAALLVFVTSCGCNNKTYTYSSVESDLKTAQLNEMKDKVRNVYTESGADDETIKAKVDKVNLDFDGTNMSTVLRSVLKDAYAEEDLEAQATEVENNIMAAMKVQATGLLPKFYENLKLKNHQLEYCKRDELKAVEYINLATTATSGDVNTKKKVDDSTNLYQIMSNYALTITEDRSQQGPIRVYNFKTDGFWDSLFNDVLVFPIGWLLFNVSKLLGGFYILGILIITLLLRTIMMPVYNSSNDMQLKQQLMSPEIKKIEDKYALRKDPESQRAKQMEQAQVYRRYKMGIGGCLPMLFQFPVFIAIYQAVSRMQFTDGTILNSKDWAGQLNQWVFGVNLFAKRGDIKSWQFWGIIILLILVVGTQVFQQIMTQKIQKWTYAKSQEDIPAYKRQAYQQSQQGNSMKFMMYFMIAMMGLFVFQSAAALGVYWLFGNIYSIVQMFVNYKTAPKRLAKLKKKLNIED